MSGIVFDTLAYANKLKEAGFTDRQAEAQAEALVAVIDNNLATKTDIELLRRDMKELEAALKRDIVESSLAAKTDIESLRGGVKVEIEALRRDMKELEAALKRDMKELEVALKRDMKELELRLEARIAESKTEIIKWCVGSVFAAVGLFAALVRLVG